MGLDVFDRLADGLDFLRLIIRNLNVKFLFQRHNELHRIQRVRAQIVHERGLRGDFRRSPS